MRSLAVEARELGTGIPARRGEKTSALDFWQSRQMFARDPVAARMSNFGRDLLAYGSDVRYGGGASPIFEEIFKELF